MVKNPPASGGDARDTGSIPGWGRIPGGGNGNPLQYSCLENEAHGQRSLEGCSPWGRKELGTTEPAHTGSTAQKLPVPAECPRPSRHGPAPTCQPHLEQQGHKAP